MQVQAHTQLKSRSLFTDRTAVIATMHRKECVIAPLLTEQLGLRVIVPDQFDTDTFGTFTREIKRLGDQLEAVKLKAQAALDLTGETLAIASEGSFGPHPIFPAIPCDREIVLLLDRQQGLEVIGQVFSTETNYSHTSVSTLAEALTFAQKVGFPDHALVVMPHASTLTSAQIAKGIITETQLAEAIEAVRPYSPDGRVHLETDMRALYNPTRMKNIASATQDLINKLNHCCPACEWPGFELIERKSGLRCAACNLPTSLMRSVVYRCRKCGHLEETLFPDGRQSADPSQCQYCNP